MLSEDRLQTILESKDTGVPPAQTDEGWAIIDGAVVVYDLNDPPRWFPHDEERDEDGRGRIVALHHPDGGRLVMFLPMNAGVAGRTLMALGEAGYQFSDPAASEDATRATVTLELPVTFG